MSDFEDNEDEGRFWQILDQVRVTQPPPPEDTPEREEYLAFLREQFAEAPNRGHANFKKIYKPEFAEQAKKLYEKGWIDAEVAEFFGVNETTLWRWATKYPEFASCRKMGKKETDDRVVNALLKRALGYQYRAEKVAFDKDGNTLRAEVIEHVPPDHKAAMNWLKNRLPNEWKDRRELTGADGAPLHPVGTPTRSKVEIARRILYTLQLAADEDGKQIPQMIEEKVTITE